MVAAKKASSPTQVVEKLVEFGLSSSSETRAFAEEVFARVPHKAAGLNVSCCRSSFDLLCISATHFLCYLLVLTCLIYFSFCPHQHYQKQEREAALLARKQKTYALLDADDDDDDSKHNVGQGGIDNGSSSIATSETGKGASRNKRFRKKSGSHEDEDEEVGGQVDLGCLFIFNSYVCLNQLYCLNALLQSVAHVDEERMVKRRTSHDEDGGSEVSYFLFPFLCLPQKSLFEG